MLRRSCSAAATEPSLVVHRRGAAVEPPVGRPSVWRHTWVGTYQGGAVHAPPAAADAQLTSSASDVDEVARTPPASGYPDACRRSCASVLSGKTRFFSS